MMFELEGDAFERDEAPSCVPPCIQSHSRRASSFFNAVCR